MVFFLYTVHKIITMFEWMTSIRFHCLTNQLIITRRMMKYLKNYDIFLNFYKLVHVYSDVFCQGIVDFSTQIKEIADTNRASRPHSDRNQRTLAVLVRCPYSKMSVTPEHINIGLEQTTRYIV